MALQLPSSVHLQVISVDPPPVVELEVVQSDPGAKGNTASGGGSKPATLSSGAEIMVGGFSAAVAGCQALG